MGKRGPACTVCQSKHRHLVDLGLVHGVSARVLANRFKLHPDAIFRHKCNHLTPQLRAALLSAQRPSDIDLEQLQRTESEGLLGSLVAQRARLQLLSELAFAEGEVAAAVSVERGITASLQLTAQLLGQLVQHHHTTHTHNILVSSDYLRLRAVIVNALRQHPEAARAVGAALAELEQEAAEQIAERKAPLVLEAQPC